MKKILVLLTLFILFIPGYSYSMDYNDVNSYIQIIIDDTIKNNSFSDSKEARMIITSTLAGALQIIKNRGIVSIYNITILDKDETDMNVTIFISYQMFKDKEIQGYLIRLSGEKELKKIKV